MPSSPLEPHQDLLRDEAYIAFRKEHVGVRRTHSLEWACATARVGSKESNRYEAVLSILGHRLLTVCDSVDDTVLMAAHILSTLAKRVA